MLSRINFDDCEIEVVKVHLKQSDYEDRIVRLVKALLEIDEVMNRADDAVVVESEAA
ncbi:MAG: hypothetical protein JNM24_08675 [Bdellovibrionaceae bacterium]|nr:hypothetical protein [Pseudobdellovibrionaceae bacterium]